MEIKLKEISEDWEEVGTWVKTKLDTSPYGEVKTFSKTFALNSYTIDSEGVIYHEDKKEENKNQGSEFDPNNSHIKKGIYCGPYNDTFIKDMKTFRIKNIIAGRERWYNPNSEYWILAIREFKKELFNRGWRPNMED